MLSSVYRLVAPHSIEPVQVELASSSQNVIVRPTHLSICNADQRYYQGSRSADVLAKKLPMALIHEGVGIVVADSTKNFCPGDYVVMLPNNPVEHIDHIAENYLRSSEFCGSGYDGFMQEYVALPPSRLVALPSFVNKNVAAFTELISVAVHAVTRFETIAHSQRATIGVWGDGNLGFIISLVLRMLYPNTKIIVFGRNRYKMDDFTFVNETHLVYEMKDSIKVDHAFECCGNEGSALAIDQIIDTIQPEGTVSLLGVSENAVPINTRMILEKGLRFFGSSRSGRADFLRTVKLYEEYPQMLDYLGSLVGQVLTVKSVMDITKAFDADIHKTMGKTIMQWDI